MFLVACPKPQDTPVLQCLIYNWPIFIVSSICSGLYSLLTQIQYSPSPFNKHLCTFKDKVEMKWITT